MTNHTEPGPSEGENRSAAIDRAVDRIEEGLMVPAEVVASLWPPSGDHISVLDEVVDGKPIGDVVAELRHEYSRRKLEAQGVYDGEEEPITMDRCRYTGHTPTLADLPPEWAAPKVLRTGAAHAFWIAQRAASNHGVPLGAYGYPSVLDARYRRRSRARVKRGRR